MQPGDTGKTQRGGQDLRGALSLHPGISPTPVSLSV